MVTLVTAVWFSTRLTAAVDPPPLLVMIGASFTGLTMIATVSTSVAAVLSVLVTVSVSGPCS